MKNSDLFLKKMHKKVVLTANKKINFVVNEEKNHSAERENRWPWIRWSRVNALLSLSLALIAVALPHDDCWLILGCFTRELKFEQFLTFRCHFSLSLSLLPMLMTTMMSRSLFILVWWDREGEIWACLACRGTTFIIVRYQVVFYFE